MPSYKVLECRFKKTFDGQRGTFSVYNLKLSDGTNPIPTEAELVQLPKTAEPQVGQTLEGTLEPSEYGWKFKRDRRSPSEAPRSPSNGKSKGEPYRKHPAEVAAVQRAHAQEMAIRHFATLHQMGRLEMPGVADAEQEQRLGAKLRGMIDWFEQDVNKAMELAELPPAEVQLRDQASRLAEAGERAADKASPRSGVPSSGPPSGTGLPWSNESEEDRNRRIRAEIIAGNEVLKDMDHV